MAANISKERLVLIFSASLIFGISTVLRKLSVNKIHPIQYQIVSCIIYAAIVIPLLTYEQTYIRVDAKWNVEGIIYSVISTAFNLIGAVIFMLALRNGNDTSLVSATMNTSIIYTTIISFLFLGENITPSRLVGIILILIGSFIAILK